MSNSHLRKIEAGEISPQLGTIHKIAVVLETDAASLVAEAHRRLMLPALHGGACFGAGRMPNVSLRYEGRPGRME